MTRLVSVLLLLGASQQPPAPLVWSTTPLTWDDFQGPPDGASRAAARTAYEIRTRVRCASELPSHDVEVLFLRDQSWIKPAQRAARTLSHEQGHFDLGEVTARRLRAALRELGVTCGAPSPEFTRLLADHERRDADLQRSYDRQTVHGTDIAAQRRWETQIASWLRELH